MGTLRRRAEEVLARWRDAERRAGAEPPGSAAHERAAADAERARLEYHALLDEQDTTAHAAEQAPDDEPPA